jgi:hypothetical protein
MLPTVKTVSPIMELRRSELAVFPTVAPDATVPIVRVSVAAELFEVSKACPPALNEQAGESRIWTPSLAATAHVSCKAPTYPSVVDAMIVDVAEPPGLEITTELEEALS